MNALNELSRDKTFSLIFYILLIELK